MTFSFPIAARSATGLTLIEMMVALAILGLLVSASVIGVGALTGTRARGAVVELGGVVRALADTAALSGRTCRLVWELGDGNGPVTYRAECAAAGATLDRTRREGEAASAIARAEKAEPGSLEELTARERERVESAARFSEFTSPEVQTRSLKGVSVSVWTAHQSKALDKGTAYLHFFPKGDTERAQVVVRQGNNAWTLLIDPLTARTRVVAEALEVPR
ncbi:MAG: Tfp pilus assembly protein FimT/FimU [Myxococcaceae bacterium]